MSDSYQAIYDAVRSRINGFDASRLVDEIARQFDVSWQKALLQEQIGAVGHEMQRPSVLFRPTISQDGNKWCARYGVNLQEGVSGFGDSPAEAMADFDRAWHAKLIGVSPS